MRMTISKKRRSFRLGGVKLLPEKDLGRGEVGSYGYRGRGKGSAYKNPKGGVPASAFLPNIQLI